MALYCTVQLLQYIYLFILSWKVLEMLVWAVSMSTLMHLTSVRSYKSVWNSYVLYYSDTFIMPLALVSISSRLLLRCYLSSLCSFAVFSLTERESLLTLKGSIRNFIPGSVCGETQLVFYSRNLLEKETWLPHWLSVDLWLLNMFVLSGNVGPHIANRVMKERFMVWVY